MTRIGVLLVIVTVALVARVGPSGAQTSDRLDRVLQRGTLIVGVKNDYPPWGMLDADGGIVGLEPDLARDLADRIGVDLELVAVSAANRLQLLDQGRIDVTIATMGDTEERRGIADLIQPHYYNSGVTLLTSGSIVFTKWGQLRGRPVCLTEGAYFNRAMIEQYLVDPLVFQGNRNTILALEDGRCVGWAFDDTVLAQLLRSGEVPGYRISLPVILSTPWAVAVRQGEGDGRLGRLVSDAIADWHRTGLLLALQEKWGLPETDFLKGRAAVWQANDDTGAPICARAGDGAFPTACLSADIARSAAGALDLPAWAKRWEDTFGIDMSLVFDAYTRTRLMQGLGLTLALSAAAIVGALLVGGALGLIDRTLARGGPASRALRLPVRAIITLARMTPPILQLYLVYFGLGAVLATSYAITPGAFLSAAVIFSMYAGSTNAVLISAALDQLAAENPGRPLVSLMPRAGERAFDGLVSTCVNIVKAAGMASTIAVAELISTMNSIITEGGDPATAMNLLLVFYFFFVLLVIWVFKLARRFLLGTAGAVPAGPLAERDP